MTAFWGSQLEICARMEKLGNNGGVALRLPQPTISVQIFKICRDNVANLTFTLGQIKPIYINSGAYPLFCCKAHLFKQAD